MGKNVTNDEIVQRLLAAKAIDFKAVGNLVADMGPDLAESDYEYCCVLVGRRCFSICIPPWIDGPIAVEDTGV